jgi:GDPmannose 4,6-dehydratase
MFGKVQSVPQAENTAFYPRSPYGVAKLYAHWMTINYRESYNIFATSGILFNHESPLRPAHFVTQKIVRAVKRIAGGSAEKLKLGRLDIARDWGWAPEYVQAMWLMLQQDRPQDFVIATGKTITLEQFVEAAFKQANLNWKDHVVQDPALFRPTDLDVGSADCSKACKELGWQASTQGIQVVEKMYQSLN